MLSLSSQMNAISGIGPALTKKLAKLEINTIQDLLWYLPTRYEDYSQITTVKNLKVGTKATIKGRITLINSRRSWKRRLTITEALINDDTGTIKAVWFNQPYLSQTLKAGDTILLAGQLTRSHYGWQLEQPTYEPVTKGGLHTSRLVPYYPLRGLITNHWWRNLINKVIPLAKSIPDWLPAEIKTKAKVISLNQAVGQLHFPQTQGEVLAGRRRLTFDELFLINLQAKLALLELQNQTAPAIPYDQETKNFVANLPWQLTPDQKKSAWEIIKDLGKPQPMFRLLQGDVGSGKTIVAGLAALNAVKAGWPVAFLAPTEILAYQHFLTLSKLFAKYPITIALLTHSQHQLTAVNKPATKITAATIKKELKAGNINIAVGTHSLLQADVFWHKLGFIIVDEQHRFGVEQRRHLLTRTGKTVPHFLSLSATPIPRSLALSIYGDLSLSLLKTLPSGRLPITTKIITPSKRTVAYELMKQEIANSHRVFIICPLIEENDQWGVKAVTTEFARLSSQVFPDIKIGLLHGKLSGQQKIEALHNFKTGQTPILVTTSVVEVGVDIPEATIMAIEGAERFGVAQLHQFRGRVGRSDKPSYCLLFTNEEINFSKRLEALVKYANGFDLAEFDLADRGPGSLMGEIQSGYLNLRYADLVNPELLATVRAATDYTLKTDPEFTNWPQIKQQLKNTDFHPE